MTYLPKFLWAYIVGFVQAATHDYTVLTVIIFGVLATVAWGVAGTAIAVGLYAVLHFVSQNVAGIVHALRYIGDMKGPH